MTVPRYVGVFVGYDVFVVLVVFVGGWCSVDNVFFFLSFFFSL